MGVIVVPWLAAPNNIGQCLVANVVDVVVGGGCSSVALKTNVGQCLAANVFDIVVVGGDCGGCCGSVAGNHNNIGLCRLANVGIVVVGGECSNGCCGRGCDSVARNPQTLVIVLLLSMLIL